MGIIFYGGESGIRTHGELPHAGFQDRYLQPLGHLSIKVEYIISRDGPIYILKTDSIIGQNILQ